VDFIQLRERDLSARDLEALARQAVAIVRESSTPSGRTRLLINSRTDIAIASQADGVHLRSSDISPAEVRAVLTSRESVIGVSCHTLAEVARAAAEKAGLVLFASVFGKKNAPGFNPAGLSKLAEACQHKIPVLALGGVTLENAAACLEAGAAGIAGIRLFQQNDLSETVRKLRMLNKR
jgi:thiamine-phosphate pyrophosphorylase